MPHDCRQDAACGYHRLKKELAKPLKQKRHKRDVGKEHQHAEYGNKEIPCHQHRRQHHRVNQRKMNHMEKQRRQAGKEYFPEAHAVHHQDPAAENQVQEIHGEHNQDAVQVFDEKQHGTAHREAVVKVHLFLGVEPGKACEPQDNGCPDDQKRDRQVLYADNLLRQLCKPFSPHGFHGLLQISLALHPLFYLFFKAVAAHGPKDRDPEEEAEKRQADGPDSPFQIFFHKLKI